MSTFFIMFTKKYSFRKADPAEKYSARSALQSNHAIDILVSIFTISS